MSEYQSHAQIQAFGVRIPAAAENPFDKELDQPTEGAVAVVSPFLAYDFADHLKKPS